MSEDRRAGKERRTLLPRDGGRRDTDPIPNHGTRARYKRGCACLCCKAAEAAYRSNLRQLHAHGKTPLGAHVSAVDTWRLIEKMLIERFTRAQIARELGFKQHHLKLYTGAVVFRNALKVRRLYRLRVVTGCEDSGTMDATY